MSAVCKRCQQQVIFAQLATGQWLPPLDPQVEPIITEDPDESRVIIVWDQWRGSYRAIAQGTNISAVKFHDCPNPRVVDREQEFLNKAARAKVRAEAAYSTAPSVATNVDLENQTIPPEPAEDDDVANQIYLDEVYLGIIKSEVGDQLRNAHERAKNGETGNGLWNEYKATSYTNYLYEYPTVFALIVACGKCGANSGEWCVSIASGKKKGTFTSRLHDSRIDSGTQLMRNYTDGR